MQELQEVLSKRDEEIRNLKLVLQQKEIQIQQKEEEIQQLRSHLDQFKSVLPFSGKAHAYPVRRSTIREPCEHEREHEREPRKVRAQGISAEPQDLKSLQDISHQKFNEYPKDERWVLIKQVAHLFFLSFTCINKPPSKSIGGNCLCVCVCIDIEKSKRENLFERNIESHTRPRGFHSKRDKLLTLIRGCLSLSFSFSFSLLYIPSIF